MQHCAWVHYTVQKSVAPRPTLHPEDLGSPSSLITISEHKFLRLLDETLE